MDRVILIILFVCFLISITTIISFYCCLKNIIYFNFEKLNQPLREREMINATQKIYFSFFYVKKKK